MRSPTTITGTSIKEGGGVIKVITMGEMGRRGRKGTREGRGREGNEGRDEEGDNESFISPHPTSSLWLPWFKVT